MDEGVVVRRVHVERVGAIAMGVHMASDGVAGNLGILQLALVGDVAIEECFAVASYARMSE